MPVKSIIRRTLRRLIRRTKSWGTVAALTLSGNRIERKSTLHHGKNPVLLIYGFGTSRRSLNILEKRIYNEGYTVFSINLGGIFDTFNTHAIEELAAYIDQKIERLYKKYEFRGKLSIVAHSKGGLIGHYYVKRLGGDRRVKLIVTLGTPHNGTPWALLASFTPAVFISKSVRQMAPMSNFIQRLKRGPLPKKVKLYSIYSKDDRMCLYPGGVLEEAPNVKNIEVDRVSHSEFLTKRQVFNVIRHALTDEMPVSLEERTREKVKQSEIDANKKTRLKLIEGARSLALKR